MPCRLLHSHWCNLVFLIADMEKEGSKAQSSKRMRVEALYRDAALSYQEAGRHQAAAEALGRAAGYLEGIEPEVARFLTVPIILISLALTVLQR